MTASMMTPGATRRRRPKRPALLMMLAAAWLAACAAEPDSPEAQIRALLQRAEEAAEEKRQANLARKEALIARALEMAEERAAPVRTHLAMGRLLDRLEAGQAAERSRFAKRFDRFASPANRKTFAQLFSRGNPP